MANGQQQYSNPFSGFASGLIAGGQMMQQQADTATRRFGQDLGMINALRGERGRVRYADEWKEKTNKIVNTVLDKVNAIGKELDLDLTPDIGSMLEYEEEDVFKDDKIEDIPLKVYKPSNINIPYTVFNPLIPRGEAIKTMPTVRQPVGRYTYPTTSLKSFFPPSSYSTLQP